MNAAEELMMLAKLTWQDPETGEARELSLAEGATVGIGRMESNEICIREQHVSRQHASITYRDGVFVITDLGSANGVFVNDQRLTAPYPLTSGDEIRLYVPRLRFDALMDAADLREITEHSTRLGVTPTNGGRLLITNGAQEGDVIPLLLNSLTIGRATTNADWDIALQDTSVSRPHARLDLIDAVWVLTDLGSANGTAVNGTPVTEKGRALHDGDIIAFGGATVLFRTS